MIWIGRDSETDTIQVTMRDSIYRPMVWNSFQAQGAAIIRSISKDNNELQKIFGAGYQILMGRMAGPSRSSKTDVSKTASKTTSASASAPSRVPPAPATATAAASNAGHRETLLTSTINRTHNQSTSTTQLSTSADQINKRPAPPDTSSVTQTAKKPMLSLKIYPMHNLARVCVVGCQVILFYEKTMFRRRSSPPCIAIQKVL